MHDQLILLDERGISYTSRKFSLFIENQMRVQKKRLIFLVGGPFGFSEGLYTRANEKIAMSAMTFPHDLIRIIFLEQLYRAFTISKNQPYHHD